MTINEIKTNLEEAVATIDEVMITLVSWDETGNTDSVTISDIPANENEYHKFYFSASGSFKMAIAETSKLLQSWIAEHDDLKASVRTYKRRNSDVFSTVKITIKRR